jgi:hypothetical protein
LLLIILSTIFINNEKWFKFNNYNDLGRIIYKEKPNIEEDFIKNFLENKDFATDKYF